MTGALVQDRAGRNHGGFIDQGEVSPTIELPGPEGPAGGGAVVFHQSKISGLDSGGLGLAIGDARLREALVVDRVTGGLILCPKVLGLVKKQKCQQDLKFFHVIILIESRSRARVQGKGRVSLVTERHLSRLH